MYNYTPQNMFRLGQIYHSLIELINADGHNPYPNAEIFPIKYLIMILSRVDHRKIPRQLERAIGQIMDTISTDEMEQLINSNRPSPLECRGDWMLGYTKYQELTEPSKITRKRKERGLSQSELADMAGLRQKDISRWENGHFTPNAENLKKLANVLECAVDELI